MKAGELKRAQKSFKTNIKNESVLFIFRFGLLPLEVIKVINIWTNTPSITDISWHFCFLFQILKRDHEGPRVRRVNEYEVCFRHVSGECKLSTEASQRRCRTTDGLICSGRGECTCGVCVCLVTEPGKFYGPRCECHDWVCTTYDGKICGGKYYHRTLQMTNIRLPSNSFQTLGLHALCGRLIFPVSLSRAT